MKVKVESFARDLVSYHVPPDLRNFENVKHLAGTFPGAEADEIRRLLIIKKKKKRTRGYYFRGEKGGGREGRGGGGLLYLEQSHPPSRLANGCLARELFSTRG